MDQEIAKPPLRVPSLFYAFTFRNYRLFYLGQTISVAGTWMQTVAQQWLVWQITGSERWLGLISFASAIPYVLFSTWGGDLADRYSRRNILIWTQALALVLAVLLAGLASGRWIPVAAWHIAVLAALTGMVNAFNMPAQQALVTDIVEDRAAISNAIALNSLRFNLARVFGPMFAGWILVRYNAATCFALNAISYIAVLWSLLLMRIHHETEEVRQRAPWEGFAYIRENRATLRTVMLVGVAALFAWSSSTLFPALAARFHVDASGYSRMMTFNGLGAAAGGLFLAAFANSLPRRTLIYGGALLFCGALLLLSFVPTYAQVLGCLTLSGFAMILFGISSQTKIQEEVPDALRGRVTAVYLLVFNGMLPLGGLQAGLLAEQWGVVPVIRFNASVCLLATVLIFLWSLWDRRTHQTVA